MQIFTQIDFEKSEKFSLEVEAQGQIKWAKIYL